MEKIAFSAELAKIHESELDPHEKSMLAEAVRQMDMAYAPYSHFFVGAAVLMENGNIHGGCNQENASYPLCMCGERVALYHATISDPGVRIKALAITARGTKKGLNRPVFPCGACRQVIHEYERRNKHSIALYFRTEDGDVYISENGSQLLPFGFDESFLLD
ncbi:MAG: cytidine deaminase [Saprospiraceae bacterium]|nr:cytidine deaminase [Saprospiraceae bacterium]